MITIIAGQHVKCFLRSGMVLEGIVEESAGAQIVLRSLSDQSLMIIHHASEDIMLTKVMPEPTLQETTVEEPALVVAISNNTEASPIQEQVKKKLHEVLQPIDDSNLQKKSLQELRLLVVERERQIIAHKKKEHFGSAGSAKMTRYSSPYMPRALPRSNEKQGK